MQLFDQNNIHSLSHPLKERYLPLVLRGTDAFFHNVSTTVRLLLIDDTLIPLTINDKEYDNAHVTSNFVFLKLKLEKLEELKGAVLKKYLIKGGEILFKMLKINKIVSINNSFFSSCHHPSLTEAQIGAMTSFLQANFPGHALIMRSVNHFHDPSLFHSLQKHSFRLIPVRPVHIFNSSTLFDEKARRHHRRDLRLISNYEVLSKQEITHADLDAFLHLYAKLYLQKHTRYSPDLQVSFLHHLVSLPEFHFTFLKYEGKLVGGFVLFDQYSLLSMPLIAFDPSHALSQDTYRTISALAFREAQKCGKLLNYGGANHFKKVRGCTLESEYYAFLGTHLPLYRSLPWIFAPKKQPTS